jgi:hypothetical protein
VADGSQSLVLESPAEAEPRQLSVAENNIARLNPDARGNSAVLGHRLTGYIALRILFLGVPVKGLKVTVSNADGEMQTEPVHRASMHWASASEMLTDHDGFCALGCEVPIGSYTCHIEHQLVDAAITTVEVQNRPFVLTLPLGRPYADLYMDEVDRNG